MGVLVYIKKHEPFSVLLRLATSKIIITIHKEDEDARRIMRAFRISTEGTTKGTLCDTFKQ